MSNEVSAQAPLKRAAATAEKVVMRGLNFYYGKTHALKDVDLSLVRGAGAADGQGRHSRSQFLLWADARAQGREPEPVRGSGDGVHRPVGLRQVDAAAGAQPHVRPLSRPARRGRGDARRREHPLARPRPQSPALAGRHGVPEADAVSDDDLRQHRLRRSPLRETAEVRDWTRGSNRRCAAPRSGPRSRTN